MPASLPAGATAYSNAYFGKGTGGIYLDNIACHGSELRLIDCSHNVIGVHNCDHSEDASLRCQRKTIGFKMMKEEMEDLFIDAIALIAYLVCLCSAN